MDFIRKAVLLGLGVISLTGSFSLTQFSVQRVSSVGPLMV